jgi:hypothetical protein
MTVKGKLLEIRTELKKDDQDSGKFIQLVSAFLDDVIKVCPECGEDFLRLDDRNQRYCGNRCGSRVRMRRMRSKRQDSVTQSRNISVDA